MRGKEEGGRGRGRDRGRERKKRDTSPKKFQLSFVLIFEFYTVQHNQEELHPKEKKHTKIYLQLICTVHAIIEHVKAYVIFNLNLRN